MLQSFLAFANANAFLGTTLQQLLPSISVIEINNCFAPGESAGKTTLQAELSRITRDSTAILTATAASQLNLSGSIVVLSACNTENGKFEDDSGGLYSMSRGFKMSGAKCIVANLWESETETHNNIIFFFYEALLMGKSIPEALRESQLKISCDALSIRDWASVICIGSTKRLEIGNSDQINN
eukprot:TRINITY_DN27427_c0_g2_i1.p3 TRINITY_DN27427_c0_g2~~TRINITY_DN27427_c0_g2_i1.p3  ORF type:complete len:183 (+),score=30.38 TRINITY_DN27427_c0_g2_i1:834-1382(+)